MSILINKDTKIVVQGFTGQTGQFHAKQCLAYGSQVVAGVTPGKGGTSLPPESGLDSVPIFNTVGQAVKKTKANASLIFVPELFAADAIMEAVDAGVKLVVCI